MSQAVDTNQPKSRKKRRIIAGVILGIILLLGIGSCAYIASIGSAWNNGTEKFEGNTFPQDDGKISDSALEAFKKNFAAANEPNKDGIPVNANGKKNITDNDKNGNGIPDDLEGGKTTDRPRESGATDILLLGSDSRAGTAESIHVQGQRADTIMLLHIPKDSNDAYLISIMRDTWVNIPGFGSAKINAGLNYGGLDLQIATIEQLLNTRIDHVAEIDFTGFKGLTDEVGGVTVNVPFAFSGDGVSFNAGPQHMDGDTALTFVRQRYQFADGDYQRVRNQRAYVDGLVQTLKGKGAFNNLVNFKSMVQTVSPYVKVDSGLDAATLASIGAPAVSSGGVDLHMMTLPNAGTGWSLDGQSIVVLDTTATDALSNALNNGTMADFVATYGSG